MKYSLRALLFIAILVSCSFDDPLLPVSKFNQVSIDDFQINLERDYISGRIVNNSDLTISSCRFQFNLYASEDSQDQKNLSPEVVYEDHDDEPAQFIEAIDPERLAEGQPLVSTDHLVRHALKPGYSTEFYFEVKMDCPSGSYVYTRQIIELRGN